MRPLAYWRQWPTPQAWDGAPGLDRSPRQQRAQASTGQAVAVRKRGYRTSGVKEVGPDRCQTGATRQRMDRPARTKRAHGREGGHQAGPSANGAIGRRYGPCRSPNGPIGPMPARESVTKPAYRSPRPVGKRIKRRRVRPQIAVSVGADKEKIRRRIANG